MDKYYVYALTKNGVAVYVGCTKSVEKRIKKHKKDKDFDRWIIIESFNDKKDALLCERSIIKFITLFGGDGWYNKEYILLAYERDFWLRNI